MKRAKINLQILNGNEKKLKFFGCETASRILCNDSTKQRDNGLWKKLSVENFQFGDKSQKGVCFQLQNIGRICLQSARNSC